MAAGYNDPTTGAVGLNTAITVVLDEARRQHVPYVVWLTYRVAGPSASRFAAHNALLRAHAATEPMLVVADWARRSALLPSSWFSGDGIHLGHDTTVAMADLVGDTLDLIARAWNGSRCVVTNTTSAAPPPTSDVPSPRAPAAATATARAGRLRLWCP